MRGMEKATSADETGLGRRAFVYLGKDEQIKQNYEKFGQAIDERYKSLLGPEKYEKLRRINVDVLNPQSYFEDLADLRNIGLDLGNVACSKFLFMAPNLDNHELNGQNNLQTPSELKTAAGFYVSAESFKHSGSSRHTDNPIGTYIHEFNHYLAFALQKVPLYMVTAMLSHKVGSQLKKPEQIKDFLQMLTMSAFPVQEKQKRVGYATMQGVFDYSYEQMNNLLDSKIFPAIGARVRTEWRNTPKQYLPINISQIGIFVFPVSGDFFQGLSDAEAFSRFLKWEDCFNLRTGAHGLKSDEITAAIHNSMESVRRMKVRKISLDELMRAEGE